MIELQRVKLEPPPEDRPAAPFIQRAPDGGWHFDCGNQVGWSAEFPSCSCGLCAGPLVWPAGAGSCQDCAALPPSRTEGLIWHHFGSLCLRCWGRRPAEYRPPPP